MGILKKKKKIQALNAKNRKIMRCHIENMVRAFRVWPGSFVGLGDGFLFFYEARSPLPMGEGPGVRSGFG